MCAAAVGTAPAWSKKEAAAYLRARSAAMRTVSPTLMAKENGECKPNRVRKRGVGGKQMNKVRESGLRGSGLERESEKQ